MEKYGNTQTTIDEKYSKSTSLTKKSRQRTSKSIEFGI